MLDIMKNELRSITLVDQLETKLLQYIQISGLKEGDSLPSEKFFAEKYKVSRNLVRESLSRLKMLNVIDSRRRRGMIVIESDPMANFIKVVKPNLLSEKSMMDLIQLRCAMEVGIAPMIFRNLKEEDIVDLEEIVSNEEFFNWIQIGVENEIKFHTRIYQIVNNEILLSFQNVVIPIFIHTSSNFSDYKKFSEELKNENKLVNHKDLLFYLKNRDEEGYKKAIEYHLLPYLNYVHTRKQELDQLKGK